MDHRQSRYNLWPLMTMAGLAVAGLAFRWASASSPDLPNLWPILAACVALLMPIGLALLASGGLPDQRAALTALMGVFALGMGSIGYLLTGFAFEFGGVGLVSSLPGVNKLIWEWSFLDKDWGLGWGMLGLRGFALSAEAAQPQGYALFFSQLAPLAVAVLLPLLALRGRARAAVLIVTIAIVSMVIYPVVGNWVWGGGWLANLGVNMGLGHGFVDFAGSGTIHLVGASAALAGLLVFRASRHSGSSSSIIRMPPVHLPLLAILGSFLALVGWIGLALSNPLLVGADVAWSIVAVNLVLAAAGGSLMSFLYSWFTTGTGNVFMTIRGLICGLVAISAACPFVPAWAALLIGAVAGLLLPPMAYVFIHLFKLADTSLILPMHGLSAVWGIIAVGIFADGQYGVGWNGVGLGTYLGVSTQGVTGYLASPGLQADFPQQLYAQIIGLLAIALFSFLVAWLTFKVMSMIVAAWEGAGLELGNPAEAEGPLAATAINC